MVLNMVIIISYPIETMFKNLLSVGKRNFHSLRNSKNLHQIIAVGYGIALPFSFYSKLKPFAVEHFNKFEHEDVIETKPIIVCTNPKDGFVLFNSSVHMRVVHTTFKNYIVGPLTFETTSKHGIYIPCPQDTETHTNKFLSILKANDIVPSDDATKYISLTNKDDLGADSEPYNDWLKRINPQNKKIKDLIGYYIIGLE